MEIIEHGDPPLTESQIRRIAQLTFSEWPTDGETVEDVVVRLTDRARQRHEESRKQGHPPARTYAVWEEEALLAHAATFYRAVSTEVGIIGLMALASVVVDPARRGEGLGAAVVKRAFSRVDSGEFPVCLYQTDVPMFYARFGARVVPNRFVNTIGDGDPNANPWEDAHVMIYPSSYPWPAGTVDMLGPGY